jgi:dTDP-4-dehydrorhamnose reductase
LLIGATGQVGADLIRNNPGHEIVAPDRANLDITRPEQISDQIRQHNPAVVVNCAAYHDVPLCEKRPFDAFSVNCVAVRDLAYACRDVGAWLVTLSTDYVFDGSKRTPYLEQDCPNPLQIYGITRLAGERAALAVAPENAIIVRTSALYGQSGAASKGGNFVDNRILDARAGKVLEMSSEQIVSPTCTHDLSRAIFGLLEHPNLSPGIYHLTNEGECSWYDLTRAIYQIIGIDLELRPVDRKGLAGTMRRPVYSVLGNTKAKSMGIILAPWRLALERHVQRKYCGSPRDP